MYPRLFLRKSGNISATFRPGKLLHTSTAVCSSEDREYLHRTRIPTYHFQRSLPKLPVPPLEKSCQRYLNAQLPLLTADGHKELQGIVSEFQNGKGSDLHKELVATDKANKDTNYVSDLWFNMYLKDRRSVVLNHNPFVCFNDDPRPAYNNQLIRAANMLISSTRFMKTLRDEKLEPEVFHLNPAKSNTSTFQTVTSLLPQSLSWYGAYLFKAFPLDMSQYQRLFNSCRIPRPEKDELYTKKSAKHILVICRGNMYIFDMLDRDGNVIPETEVLAHLKYILEDPTPPPEYPVSALTSESRDVWTRARVQLINADSRNEDKLRLIESSMFALCLDDQIPKDPNEVSSCFLYGDGVNRWYDKCFQLILTKDGKAAVHFEHSWGDGVAVLRYFREVFADSTRKPQVHPDTQPSKTANSDKRITRLEFKLDPFLKETIKKAQNHFDDVTSSLDIHHLYYTRMAKLDVKKAKLSPDSIMQLAIQLAHYQMYGKNVGTYESCSTSAFKHGRTETVRSCTSATKSVCEKLYGKGGRQGSNSELMEILRTCSTTHGQLTKEAALGQGFDRHLFCLKNLAEKHGLSLPMFTNPAYANLNHIILSTSTLSDPAVQIGGFAAVTPDGFGIGYSIEDKHIGFNVSTYPACNVKDFISCCEKSLNDIHSILHGAQSSEKS